MHLKSGCINTYLKELISLHHRRGILKVPREWELWETHGVKGKPLWPDTRVEVARPIAERSG